MSLKEKNKKLPVLNKRRAKLLNKESILATNIAKQF